MKKLLIAASALIFIACGSTETKTETKVVEVEKEVPITGGLTLNTATPIAKGYEVQPIGGKASFEVDVQDGKNYVTLTAGKAIIQKSN